MKHAAVVLPFTLAAALAPRSIPGQAQETQGRLVTREVAIGPVPTGRSLGRVVVSPDGKRAACVAVKSPVLGRWSQSVVVDGQEGQEFFQVQVDNLVFSPDSRRIAYVVGGNAVVDGQPGQPYRLVGFLVFSPDGERVAYAAKRGKKWLVVVNGGEGKDYDEVGVPLFSPDSKRVAYAARRGKKSLVVVNGQEGKDYDSVGVPLFGPDSLRVAYAAERGKERLVVVDGQESAPYEGTGGLRFSADGRRVAFAAKRGGAPIMVVDGKESNHYQRTDEPVFSPDGQRVAYCAQRAKKWLVVVDGQEGQEYDDVVVRSSPFSPDGQRVAYSAQNGKKWLVVVDGQEGKGYDEVGGRSHCPGCKGVHWMPVPPTFSPDGKRVAYAARRTDRWLVVVDEEEGKDYDEVAGDSLAFSPDGKRVAYRAGRGNRWLVVVDGQEGQEYDDLAGNAPPTLGKPLPYEARPPIFSPDSKHVAYRAQRGKAWRVVVDAQESKDYDQVLASLVFDTPSTLHALAVRNGQLFRLEILIE